MTSRKRKSDSPESQPHPGKRTRSHKRKVLNRAPLAALIIGVDVGKAYLDVAFSDESLGSRRIANRQRNLASWLKELPPDSALIVESTGEYHLLVVHLAFSMGHQVFIVNPSQVRNYRGVSGTRAKTDRIDAYLLADFGFEQWRYLRRYLPVTRCTLLLTKLVRQRATITRHRAGLKLCLGLPAGLDFEPEDLAAQQVVQDEMTKGFEKSLEFLDKKIMQLISEDPALQEGYNRLNQVPGIGPIIASTILAALGRGEFTTANAFVGYTGLDPVACQSGQKMGRRRLSKRGDPHLRQMLYLAACAAITCKSHPQWRELYDVYLSRNLKPKQALVILARRMAEVAWGLVKRKEDYSPARLRRGLTQPAVA